jgi:hypothetical protein
MMSPVTVLALPHFLTRFSSQPTGLQATLRSNVRLVRSSFLLHTQFSLDLRFGRTGTAQATFHQSIAPD